MEQHKPTTAFQAGGKMHLLFDALPQFHTAHPVHIDCLLLCMHSTLFGVWVPKHDNRLSC